MCDRAISLPDIGDDMAVVIEKLGYDASMKPFQSHLSRRAAFLPARFR